MPKRRKINETEEAERVEWFVYNGGNIEPEKGVRYTHIRVEGTTRIDDDAFKKCRDELLKVDICIGVKEIGKEAFDGCQHLESVAFPSTLTSIGYSAFDGCKSLKRVKLNEGLESVGGGAFMHCTSLEFINLPSTVTSRNCSTFSGCKSLKSIEIPPSVNSIAYGTFCDCTSLESIIIPPSITSIDQWAFKGCKKLKEVTFQSPHQLRNIHTGAFQNCVALKEINIPATVTRISLESFKSCKNLKKVDFCGGSPKVEVEACAFGNCPKLDYSNIISSCKMNIDTFRRFARADLSRRIGSMTDERQAMIETKLNAIPNQIVAGPSSRRGGIPQSMQDSLAKVHGLITFWELKVSTTIIELAVWRLSLDGEIDVESRQRIRQQCGRDMCVIMRSVLQFFDYNTDQKEAQENLMMEGRVCAPKGSSNNHTDL